jgi:hypothetical protein
MAASHVADMFPKLPDLAALVSHQPGHIFHIY